LQEFNESKKYTQQEPTFVRIMMLHRLTEDSNLHHEWWQVWQWLFRKTTNLNELSRTLIKLV